MREWRGRKGKGEERQVGIEEQRGEENEGRRNGGRGRVGEANSGGRETEINSSHHTEIFKLTPRDVK